MFSFRLTAYQGLFFYYIAGSSDVLFMGEKEEVRAKENFWRKLTPGVSSTFLPISSLLDGIVSLIKFTVYLACPYLAQQKLRFNP